jgi:hypothetical protein
MESLKYWNYDTFEIASYKWKLEERKGKKVIGNGSDKGKCIYTFNEFGFRGDSYKTEGVRILSVGCSHTEGIGVNDSETWSHILSRKIVNGVDLNFGLSGRSNDYICRTILSWTERINPKIVLIMYTYPHRREYYSENGGVEPYHPTAWGYFSEDIIGKDKHISITDIVNDEENFINWYKNHLLITYFLKSKNIPFVWNGTFLNTEYTDDNRFDGDYPKLTDNHSHATFEENSKYANKLYNYIKNKFTIFVKK